VTPNLALHATLFGWAISDPELTIDSESVTLPATLSVSGIGAGATYYLMPANVYLSGSVGFGTLTFEVDSVSVDSDYGTLFDATLGKEWWVGENWGIGVAGSINYHSIPDPSTEDNWTGMGFALRFTATMN
jgi:hypothetical protein